MEVKEILSSSVIIAMYNGEKYIYQQLDSIRNQHRMPDQVVICDDHSLDDSSHITQTYINEHNLNNHWSLIVNNKNLGYIKNFYLLMSKCNSDIIFLSDQDDVWTEDKIQKMMSVFEARPDISMLCCKYSIIDEQGQPMHGILVDKQRNSGSLDVVHFEDILLKYRWPGMTMGIRKTFIDEVLPSINCVNVPHDFILSLIAADRQLFWEIDFTGVYHRRHGNNAAHEEHRILKNLNYNKKLNDLSIYNEMLASILNNNVPLSVESHNQVKRKLSISEERGCALKKRSIASVLKLYFTHRSTLRFYSFLCDMWLVLFGGYQ
jgi:glycosyltransferase involved in cell wall biosynthesis